MERKKDKQSQLLKTATGVMTKIIFIKKKTVFRCLLFFATLFIPATGLTQDKIILEYSIEGTIDWVKKGKIYLLKENDLDSAKINESAITEGHFLLKGNFPFSNQNRAELVYIAIVPYKDKISFASRLIYLEPLKINVSITKDSGFIIFDFEGSPIQKKYMDYWTELIKHVKDTIRPLRDKISIAEKDSAKKEQLLKLQDSLNEKKRNLTAFIVQYIEKNKNMEMVYLNASVNFNEILETERGREFLSQLCITGQNNFPASEWISGLCNAVASIDKISPGKKAPEFSLPDPKNKLIGISSLLGKYVLIDFWASWCSPCRKEFPELKDAYKKFKPMGFEILSVSIDRNKKHWIKAIEAEGIDWPQVLDINSKIMDDYNFSEVPYNVLLDTKGDILAVDLHDEELVKKLEELFTE